MKIRSVGAELLHADGRTDRYDEANSRFSQFCERASKPSNFYIAGIVTDRINGLFLKIKLR
jgi:hypothetical protein